MTMSRLKRKRPASNESPRKNIEHYFSKSSNTTETTASTITLNAADSFQSDLKRAIEQSLAESADTTAATSLYLKSQSDNVDQGDASTKNCPICDIELTLTANPNGHINKCLDDIENVSKSNTIPSGTSHKEGTSGPCSNPQDRATIKSIGNEQKKDIKKQKTGSTKPKKTCPFYKWIQGTSFVVDAFSFGKIEKCQGYFLSHFHSDHYTSLSSSWSHGLIYCSKVTANLLKHQLRVDSKYIVALPMDQEYPLGSNINVCLIDANHCPGSVLLLFKIFRPYGSIIRHLHTGDFRANPRMCLHPLIRQPENGAIDTLYLDTTYLSGQYSFPAQEEVISATCDLAMQCCGSVEPKESKPSALHIWLQKSLGGQSSAQDKRITHQRPNEATANILFVVGTYSIGKEKLFHNLAKRLKSKIYAPAAKRALLAHEENKELDSLMTDDPLSAQVHVIPLNQIQEERLSLYLNQFQSRFTSVIAFRPTGWTFSRKTSAATTTALSEIPLAKVTTPPSDRTVHLRPQNTTISTVKIYGVPYSEHSSFRELASFISSLRIKRIIPTVNVGSETSREKQFAILDRWQKEKEGKEIRIVTYPNPEHW